MFAIFLLMQFIMSKFFSPKTDNAAPNVPSGPVPPYAERKTYHEVENWSPVPNILAPIWPTATALDVNVYVASAEDSRLPAPCRGTLVLQERNFTVGNYSDVREIETVIKVPKEAQNNGTLFAQVCVALAGHQIDPHAADYSNATAYWSLNRLNQYLPKRKAKKLKNLLSAATEEEGEEVEDNTPNVQMVSYYHPNFTLSLIPDLGTVNYQQLHPAVRQYLHTDWSVRDASGQNGWYYPLFFLNTFWQLKSQMMELNSTVDTVPLRITLNNLANWKFNMIASLDYGNKVNTHKAAFGSSVPAGGDGSEFEMIKEVLLNTNIWLLGTTGVVSILHMVFETLAFKNDIVSPLGLGTFPAAALDELIAADH